MMMDVCAGVTIKDYVDFHPKMYSIFKKNNRQIQKAKGVKKCAVKKNL